MDNIFYRYEQITGTDIESFFDDFVDFMQNKYQNISSYYTNGAELKSSTLDDLEDLSDTSNTIVEQFKNYKNQLNTYFDMWELLDQFESIRSKIQTILNSSQWFRSNKGLSQESDFEKEYILSQGQTLERLAKDVGYDDPKNDWTDIALRNNLNEEDYDGDGGSLIKIVFKNGANYKLNSVLDGISGLKSYGKDIQRQLEYEFAGDYSAATVVDFDGIDDYTSMSTIPDVIGDKKITFNLWVDNESGYSALSTVMYIDEDSGSGTDHFQFLLNGAEFVIGTRDAAVSSARYDMTGFGGKLLECEVVKDSSSIISFKINGATQTSLGLSSIHGASARCVIGGLNVSNFLTDAYVWDIKIYDDPSGTNTLIHNWAGDGVLDSNWVDLVGSSDGVVNGSPSVKTLTIEDTREYTDLITLGYKNTINQAFEILLNTVQGSVPEFPEDGISADLVGSNVNAFQYPVIFRQLGNLIAKDDSFESFEITSVDRDEDQVSLALSVTTRINEILNQQLILQQ